MTLTPDEAALVEFRRAVAKAKADGTADLLAQQEAAAARQAEQARQAAEVAAYTPEQRAVLALTAAQQQALTWYRAWRRLKRELEQPAVQAALAEALDALTKAGVKESAC
jgi:hypothetical protein